MEEMVRPHPEELVCQTQLAGHLGVLQGASLIYADKVESAGMIRVSTFDRTPQ